MIKLEDLEKGMLVQGLVPEQTVKLTNVQPIGTSAITLDYETLDGRVGREFRYREDLNALRVVQSGRLWSFDGDAYNLRLVSEAYRIHLAHLFDPILAVHTSLIDPLPHQITAVYEEMLTRYPLRFLLADDPGSGKTIMAGLLIRELMLRGDVRRCLICVPGKLVGQWRDELRDKFRLEFDVIEDGVSSNVSNPFKNRDQLIISVDRAKQVARMSQLKQVTWDLVICDEAHQLSARFVGSGRVDRTQRYRLGELLSKRTRHLLFLTATPHNGREGDFQLFLKLLNAERFGPAHQRLEALNHVVAAEHMRRMVKEDLRQFDGKPLFPERKAYTVTFNLSGMEQALYEAVSNYIRDEFNRADNLENRAKYSLGFAMMILQRRLASSPEAIYQSLRTRRRRLEERLRANRDQFSLLPQTPLNVDADEYDQLHSHKRVELEHKFSGSFSGTQFIDELTAEVDTLSRLERQADNVRCSGLDRKWEELSALFVAPELQNEDGTQRKLVIFTEYVATLNYLKGRLDALFPNPDAVVTIHGSVNPVERRRIEERFRNDPNVLILVATDAAGEGINLQCAHLMVNYDLPWNPNRLEQRFGRIHRIGQTEVCHLWNLVASDTREGQVYTSMLDKINMMSTALQGQVFDILGELISEASLIKLMEAAIRYGNDPATLAKRDKAIDNHFDQQRVSELLRKQALVTETLDLTKIPRLKVDLEAAQQRRLQMSDVKAFFFEAFEFLGGNIETLTREPGRYALYRVPAELRDYANDREMRRIQVEYRRICFDKELIHQPNRVDAEFICPGHPLLDTIVCLMREREGDTLKRGAVLIDDESNGLEPRVLFYLQQEILDSSLGRDTNQRAISREIHFLELDASYQVSDAGPAPFLDYRPASPAEQEQALRIVDMRQIQGETLEEHAITFAVEHLVPPQLDRVRDHRVRRAMKIKAAIEELRQRQSDLYAREELELRTWRERVEREERQIREDEERWSVYRGYLHDEQRRELEKRGIEWIVEELDSGDSLHDVRERFRDQRELSEREELEFWERKLDEIVKEQRLLEEQLQRRERELEREQRINAAQPVVIGGALIVPASLLSD